MTRSRPTRAGFQAARERILDAFNDDLGAPYAVGLLNAHGSYRLWVEFDAILGLDIAARCCQAEAPLSGEVQTLIEARNEARRGQEVGRVRRPA